MSQSSVSLVNWVNSELTRYSTIPEGLFGDMKQFHFDATVALGRVCLAFRHMREKASTMGASPTDWDRIIGKLFPKLSLEKINIYVSAGHNLHWDIDLINKFQSLIPSEIINFNGTPVEPMADQLSRMGLVTTEMFDHWARTNEDAKQKAIREAEEARRQAEQEERQKAAQARQEQEQRARETKALHEAEVRRLEAEKKEAQDKALEARERAVRIASAAYEAEVKATTEAEAQEAAKVKAEAQRASREARAMEEASLAKAEEAAQAEEAAKAAEGLDPKYERMLDKLISQSQGFPKMERLFEQVATAIDLLPRKKVEALKRNMLCVARIADQLFVEV
jgi:pyruvate/2-oxoglutarate dehydrogenase complex dihydrolipoamide acyltransferase (E2) component